MRLGLANGRSKSGRASALVTSTAPSPAAARRPPAWSKWWWELTTVFTLVPGASALARCLPIREPQERAGALVRQRGAEAAPSGPETLPAAADAASAGDRGAPMCGTKPPSANSA